MERLALHPNQVWHVNLFAVFLVEAFVLVIVASRVLWQQSLAESRFERRPARSFRRNVSAQPSEP